MQDVIPTKDYNIAESLLWQTPGFVGFKDVKSIYLAANKNTTCMFGYRDIDDIVGISDFDIKGEAAKNAPIFQQQDRQTIKNGEYLSLEMHRYADDQIVTVLCKKKKIFDKQGNLIGTAFNAMEINSGILFTYWPCPDVPYLPL